MFISVIVPFLNEEKYLERCIHSLLAQDFNQTQYELIFIDNGSRDNSAAIVKQFPRIQLLSAEKRNDSSARNEGLKIARGEIYAFTNADCMVNPQWLTAIHKKFQENNAAYLIGPCFFRQESSPLLRLVEAYENTKYEYILQQCASRFFCCWANNMAISAALFRRHGFFLDEHRGGDTEFLQRCISKESNLQILWVPEMISVRLEIMRLSQWLKKSLIDAQGNCAITQSYQFKSLPFAHNMRIYHLCAQHYHYGIYKKTMLWLVLFFHFIAYKLGVCIGYLKYRKGIDSSSKLTR